jgi:hypothetical protein
MSNIYIQEPPTNGKVCIEQLFYVDGIFILGYVEKIEN